jgi:hypothetical protein
MSKRFYAPARHQMALPGDVPHVNGGIIFPAGIMADALVRRNLVKNYPHLSRRLLDPQLYLATLQAVNCRKACTNLWSYPWFNSPAATPYESAKQTQAERRKEVGADIHKLWAGQVPTEDNAIQSAVESCVSFQLNIGCEAIILPSPLTVEQGSNFSIETNWMDKGIAAAKAMAPHLPCYPTIALSDTSLRGIAPYDNDLLTVIVDQVTARSLPGAYIVIEQSNEAGYHCAHSNTTGALLRLTHELRGGGVKDVVIGPIGFAGLLALFAGATTWCAGWYRTERRIKLSDFDDRDGRSYHTFCSFPAATDIHLDTDMDRIVTLGYLARIADYTDASETLMRAMSAGMRSGSVPEWAYQPANVRAAREHFLRIATRETRRIGELKPDQMLNEGAAWVANAEDLATQLYRQGRFNVRTELNHQPAWNAAYKLFLAST